jgi:anti-anti-sigma factor
LMTISGIDVIAGTTTCVFHLEGDVDISVVPEVRESLDGALQDGCENVVLDLERVTYADSSALGLLVWLDHRLRPVGGKLILSGANRDVTRILEISGLAYVASDFAMSSNVDAALEGLRLPEKAADSLWTQDLEMEARPELLSAVREQIAGALAPLGFPDAALFDVKVALGEALSNAVRHGQPLDRKGRIRVAVTAYQDRVVIDVIDNGIGFDGAGNAPEDVYASGGRGLMFMRALVDRVEFLPSTAGGTTVRLVKHRIGRVS